ncbi:hypothetical protein GCM10022254_13240 [Actinomadura meridiana]|uniref:Uncharacterized protein n=1 Tax=Actinomadura meridiana TaxID=559626 RepID=A0ABP8BUS4_9ACTN
MAVSVAAGSVGLAVIAVCAFRLWLAVRRFGRELQRTRRRLVPKQLALRDELGRAEHGRRSQPSGDGVPSA